MGTRYNLFMYVTQVKKLHIDRQYFNEPDQISHIGFSDNSLLVELMFGNHKKTKGRSVDISQEA